MTTLTITSGNQGLIYNEAASVQSFAVVEKLAGVAGAVLRVVRSFKLDGATLRPAQA